MATNSPDGINYFLVIDEHRKNDLGAIRHWANIMVGFDENQIWLKDLEYDQVNSTTVKSIPYKKVYYEKDSMLYLQNSRLPDRTIPSLVWTKIDRALPIEVPSFNHNFFGIKEDIHIQLIPSDREFEAVGMLTKMDLLKAFINTAPAIRLQGLKWVLLNNDAVFILGNPMLPIQGEVFWKYRDMLMPVGYDFELHVIRDTINDSLNPTQDKWIVWNKDATYFDIEKEAFAALSLGSFRITTKKILSNI